MQQRILALHSLAAGNEGDAWQAWVTLLLHPSVSEGSLTSLVLGLSTQMRNHCPSVLRQAGSMTCRKQSDTEVPGVLI